MLHYGELEDVLDNYCEIGMYDPKSGTDDEIVVINLFFTEEDAGRDLKQFIEYMPINIVDVTVQNTMYDEFYKIFIELEKDNELFKNVCRILRDCAGLAEIDEWRIKVYRKEEHTISIDDIEKIIGKTEPELDDDEDEKDVK